MTPSSRHLTSSPTEKKSSAISINNTTTATGHNNVIPKMSLPPANTDPAIPPLRKLLGQLYTPVFTALPLIQSIMGQIHTRASSSPASSNATDDLAWAKESLDGDVVKIETFKKHITFLNAEETHTTQAEMLEVFGELMDFVHTVLMDDLIAVLVGVDGVLSQEERMACKVNGRTLLEVVDVLKRFMVALKVAASGVRAIDTKKELSQSEVLKLGQKVESRLDDLEKRFDSLMLLA